MLLSPVWTRISDVHAVRGEGVRMYDAAGTAYLDFTAGIGVLNTGHCHPRVVQAIKDQADQLLFGQINCVVPAKTVELTEKLAEIMPAGIDRFYFANGGAEATEAAVKLAKAATGRQNTIVFQGSFHGRTHLAMAMTTSKTVYRTGYHPLPAGIAVAPFPHAFHFGWDEDTTVDFCIKQFELLLKSRSAPEETAAIVIEPVLGEGGYVPAPARFLRYLRDVCDRYGICLVLDEVQSGFGRTGRMFAFEHAGVRPDIVIMAKGLGSGLPISAIAASAALMDAWRPGTHGGTYGGGAVISAAAACATLDVLRDEHLPERAAHMGAYLQAGLRALQARHSEIGDVRGLGLMTATEFVDEAGEPSMAIAKSVQKACIANRLLLLTCSSFNNVIRWIPPLVVEESDIDEALGVFEAALCASGPVVK
ncbi:MAG: aminotransferase class III-fold pyridoxal phosphate-dependent enzyme [Bacteroidota bacterium]